MKHNINKSAQVVIENEGIVPYNEQTPEQRKQLIGRIQSMVHIAAIGEQLRSNFPHVVGAIPENPTSKELRIIKTKLKAIQKEIPSLISFANNVSSVYQTLCTNSEDAKEQFDIAGIYVHNIIHNTHNISIDNLAILSMFTESLIKGEVNALSDEDHDKQMLSFANYCIKLSGRKNITKNDLKKFKNEA